MLRYLKILNKNMIWVVVALVIAGGILRFYRLDHIMQFAGDQGRDALRVSRIFKDQDLVFIGPVTSIGNMYLGPFYYYFMLPWLWLSYPSPVGPAYAIAFLSTLSIGLIYWLGQKLIGKTGALIATVLFTFSSLAITYANFSWNPNPAPFVSLILLWALFLVSQNKTRYWLLVGLSFSILIQLHYMTLLAFLPIIFVWLRNFSKLFCNSSERKLLTNFFVHSLLAFLIGALFLLPLFLFDWKHQGTNIQALKDLFGGQNSITQFVPNLNIGEKIFSVLTETHGRAMDILLDVHVGQDRYRNTLILIVIGLVSLVSLRRTKDALGIRLILAFLLTGILGTSFYSHNLYPHYVLYLLPFTFLFFGWLLASIWQWRFLGKLIVLCVCGFFVLQNVKKYSYHDFNPNVFKLSQETKEIVDKIYPDEKYNLVLFSQSKDYYGQNYRYFLSTYQNKAPVDPDLDNVNAVDTLVVIDELGLTDQEILSSEIYELQPFKNAKKQGFSTQAGTKILILKK